MPEDDLSRAAKMPLNFDRIFQNFRPIKKLIDNYLAGPNTKRPMSVAVFGPPGSGKSYYAHKLARDYEPQGIVTLALSVSSLRGPSDLIEAFKPVLKAAQAGATPFVIVDEFDARASGWIPHLLAPMEGYLRGDTDSGEVKKAVFVFTGSAEPTLASFVNKSDPGRSKVPDFVARLHAYLNLSVPESIGRFRNVCRIIVPDFEEINKEMLEYFAAHPDALQELEWRRFEELLDAVFRNQGFQTILGPGRADGGIDLRLVSKDSIGAITTLVQAKRYDKRRPIELQAVQALSAAVDDERANRGLFVTTSRYLPVAKRFAARQTTKLQLATSADVARWCEEASRLWPRAGKKLPD